MKLFKCSALERYFKMLRSTLIELCL